MDRRAGSSLKHPNDDANNSPSKFRKVRDLGTDEVQRLEAPRVLSFSRPNGAEISMRNASMVSTFAGAL